MTGEDLRDENGYFLRNPWPGNCQTGMGPGAGVNLDFRGEFLVEESQAHREG